ncbi:MAG: CU044_2847 family protein [Trueperaceae bacterium]|nr:CU044_2847 family protein [Trueperaceae bacterium]
MKKIIPIKLSDDNDNVIYAEVNDAELIEKTPDGVQRVSRGRVDSTEVRQSFEKALDQLKPAVVSVVNSFKDINTPSKINIELGVNFSGTLGAVIASTSSDVAFKVTLEWDNSLNSADE